MAVLLTCVSCQPCLDIAAVASSCISLDEANMQGKEMQTSANRRKYAQVSAIKCFHCFTGDPMSAQDAPRVLREVLRMLTLSHADSNEAPLPAHIPLMTPVGAPLYPTPVPSLPNTSQDFEAAPLRRLHRAVSGPAQGYSAQPLYSQRSQRYSADVELHSRHLGMHPTSGQSSAEPTVHNGIAYHAVHGMSGDCSSAQQGPLYDILGSNGEPQHAQQQHTSGVAHGISAEAQARR